MFRHIMDAVIDEFNTGLCLRDIANHWRCRCTVPGPGMREAGQLLVDRYLENGAATAEMIRYPADDRTLFLGSSRNQLEWRPYGASLAVVGGQEICNYADEPLCLTCYSVATPPEGIEADVVLQHGPLAPEDVQEGQWTGKIVFTDQFPSTVATAVGKSGAVGMVSDCISPPWLVQYPPVREPEDMPDLVMWTIFSGERSQPQIFGFNLSPRQGRRLRQLIAGSLEPVKLRAVVRAETLEGSSDFVHATLRGSERPEEEIWVLAHLSEPGARDNASGCCASLEVVRTLTTLVHEGKLPPPKRTIRFMHGVEVHGFLPYIHDNQERLPQVLAGFCADALAEDFARCGGQVLFFLSPEPNASFVDGLCQTLLRAIAAEPVGRFTSDNYAIFPWDTRPFWGNDAFVSDGFFDIPTPQFSCWPDKHYHSSQDVPGNIAEAGLARMGSLLATYVALLASAGADEARWLGTLAAQDFKQRIARRVEAIVAAGAVPLPQQQARQIALELWHLGLQGQDAITQAGRFAAGEPGVQAQLATLADDLARYASQEAAHVLAALSSPPDTLSLPAFPADTDGADLIPRRARWHLDPDAHDAVAQRLWPWINGRRSALQITECLQYTGEVSLEQVVAALRGLAESRMVEFVDSG